MKRSLTALWGLCLVLLLSACGQRQDELEQVKAAYAKYDAYEALVAALENEEFETAQNWLDAYRAAAENRRLEEGTIQKVTISAENWSEYFQIAELTEWCRNDMGEPTGFITHLCIVAAPEYAHRILPEQTELAFEWEALCSVKNCSVDLENQLLSFENVFQSGSTSFGDPEILSGTVAFSTKMETPSWAEGYCLIGEIGEIVIIGEYSLDGEMKPVCFDYDDTKIVQAEGLLTVLTGEQNEQ